MALKVVLCWLFRLQGDFADRVYDAFSKGKGAGDRLDLLQGLEGASLLYLRGDDEKMGKYLFDNRSGLGNENGSSAQAMTSAPHTRPFPFPETLAKL